VRTHARERADIVYTILATVGSKQFKALNISLLQIDEATRASEVELIRAILEIQSVERVILNMVTRQKISFVVSLCKTIL